MSTMNKDIQEHAQAAQPIAGELPPLPEMVQDYATAYGHQCRAAALEEAAQLVNEKSSMPSWTDRARMASLIRALNKGGA